MVSGWNAPATCGKFRPRRRVESKRDFQNQARLMPFPGAAVAGWPPEAHPGSLSPRPGEAPAGARSNRNRDDDDKERRGANDD